MLKCLEIEPHIAHMPEAPNNQDITPNSVSFDDGIKALLTRNVELNSNGTMSRIRGKTDPISGRTIITYTLDYDQIAYKPPPESDEKTPRTPIDDHKEACAAIERAMREIEEVANVRFERVTTPDDMERANIRFFEGEPKGVSGETVYTPNAFSHREITIDTNSEQAKKPGYFDPLTGSGHGTVLHEILHAIGISHPNDKGDSSESGGDNNLFDNRGTVMSYNSAAPRHGLGPYDVAAL